MDSLGSEIFGKVCGIHSMELPPRGRGVGWATGGLRIHSMELPPAVVGGTGTSWPDLWNPFNGITTHGLPQGEGGGLAVAVNPFNGITTSTSPRRAGHSCAQNPFNGIERSHQHPTTKPLPYSCESIQWN